MRSAYSRSAYRRWGDERIWREFMIAALPVVCDRLTGRELDASEAAKHADAAYAEYRKRFPVATDPPALDSESPDSPTDSQTKRGVQ